jgi:divalent metal cation (Fe/Co/Zn/Cd) transporter
VVNPDISVVQSHDIATNVEKELKQKYGIETQVSIHIEPGKEAE